MLIEKSFQYIPSKNYGLSVTHGKKKKCNFK